MTRLEIILEVNGEKYYLDTQGVDTIPLTFNIANIKDISTTKGSFSKSINIPETPNNRNVFNNISDLNSYSSFNPNIRNRAYILVDGEMIIEGYFQLTDVSVDLGNHNNHLTLVINTDNNDFYTLLGEDYIDTLDLSRFDHVWSETNIKHSWTQSYTNGYFYPMIDYGYDWMINNINGNSSDSTYPNNYIKTKDFKPALYARVIWDQIFTEAGFSWHSNSLSTNTPFDDLIIPFNLVEPGVSDVYLNDNSFRVGLSSSVPVVNPYWYIVYNGSLYYFSQPSSWGPNYNLETDPYSPPYNTGTVPVNKRVPFDNETPPNGDPNNLWSTTLFQYTNTSGYPITQRFGFDLTISQLFYYASGNPPTVQLKRSRHPITGATVSGGYNCQTSDTNVNMYYPVTDQGSDWTRLASAGFGQAGLMGGFVGIYEYEKFTKKFYSPIMQLFAGEKVWLEYNFYLAGDGGFDYAEDIQDYWSNPYGQPVYEKYLEPGLTVSYLDQTSYMFNEVSQSSNINQPISINSCIPKKIKKRDFILSLIKMFNLVVEPDKKYPRTLNIETRDYYYRTGVIKDWSSKVDTNDTIDIQILGDTQNRRTRFKYKDDKDFFNKDYTDHTQLSYGEYNYISENEFTDGEKSVEILFSPTPMSSLVRTVAPGSTGSSASTIIIPRIGVTNNNKFSYAASNIRILQKKYITNLSPQDSWKFNYLTQSMTGYPYSGHLDDPFTPSMDINFGQTSYLYFPQTTVTNQNLYTKYWENMIDEISDRNSRIITLSMYLTPYDIIDFKFNDNIYIDYGYGGQYYKVNKIEGYDPTSIKTCRVELIKTKDITVKKQYRRIRPLEIPYKPLFGFYKERDNTVLSPYVNITGINNTAINGNIEVVGNNNNINSANVFVSGSDNTVGANNVNIMGSDNTLDFNSPNNIVLGSGNTFSNTNNTTVIGSNNTFTPIIGSTQSITNVTVIGSGVNVSTSNSTTIGGIIVICPNYISGSTDEVLDPFNDNWNINYISGSIDEVRNLGSQTTINIISSGRDNIL